MATPHLPRSPQGANASPVESVQGRIETLVALARLLDRVEGSGKGIGADQYRAVVARLQAALSAQVPEPALEAILSAHPGASEVYENLHYEQSGLSRSSLDRSVSTEMLAAQAIARAARRGP